MNSDTTIQQPAETISMLSSSRLLLRYGLNAKSLTPRIPQTATKPSALAVSRDFVSWLGNSKDENSGEGTDSTKNETVGTIASTHDDVKVEKVKIEACGDVDDLDEDEMEQEEMFVEAYDSTSFAHGIQEWGGPRRGGRFPEPTRFGDWEQKGRCSDF